MKRKDLTPENEALLKLYNDTHEYKIKMEHVEEIYVLDNILTIIFGNMTMTVHSWGIQATTWIFQMPNNEE